MKSSYYNDLPHLKGSIPQVVFGYPLSMYCVALEGWRRGLTLKFYNKNRKAKASIDYSLEYKGQKHYFSSSRGDLVPKEAIRTCINKHKTKKILEKAGIPVPKGYVFNNDITDEEIINKINDLNYPVVVKPLNDRGGKGVITNIHTKSELRETLKYVRKDLGYSDLIVEEHIQGEDHRVFVVGDYVVGSFKRIPANVIGDGKHTIDELLKRKNLQRNKNPALYKLPIKIDKESLNTLKSNGYTLESIPKKGERVFLNSKSNVSSGGDCKDSTDELSEEVKNCAIKAAKAIPGLIQCGIDIIVDSKTKKGVVLEINSKPSIRNHLFPMEGKGRDIPKAIIDYYFPDSPQRNESYYFDIEAVFNLFENGLASEVTIPDIPTEKHLATRFIVSGNLKSTKYEKWVSRQASNLNLHGYIKYLKNGDAAVIVSGTEQSIDKFRKIIRNKLPRRAKVTNVSEKIRKSPVKLGFEILG